jgi:hypothetical protein
VMLWTMPHSTSEWRSLTRNEIGNDFVAPQVASDGMQRGAA